MVENITFHVSMTINEQTIIFFNKDNLLSYESISHARDHLVFLISRLIWMGPILKQLKATLVQENDRKVLFYDSTSNFLSLITSTAVLYLQTIGL